jgi:hypothetical protein
VNPDAAEAMDYRLRFSHPHWMELVRICAKHVPMEFAGIMTKYNDPDELVSNWLNYL